MSREEFALKSKYNLANPFFTLSSYIYRKWQWLPLNSVIVQTSLQPFQFGYEKLPTHNHSYLQCYSVISLFVLSLRENQCDHETYLLQLTKYLHFVQS